MPVRTSSIARAKAKSDFVASSGSSLPPHCLRKTGQRRGGFYQPLPDCLGTNTYGMSSTLGVDRHHRIARPEFRPAIDPGHMRTRLGQTLVRPIGVPLLTAAPAETGSVPCPLSTCR